MNFLRTYWPALIITLTALIIGISVYQDYGLSFDEESQRGIGNIFYEYANGRYPGFDDFELKDHGPGFEWPLMLVENLGNINDYRDIFLMRHLFTFIVFVLCMFSGYVLVYSLFKNKWIASIALIALLFHPRMFAHAFFNPKDIPAMSMFLLTLAISRWAFEKKKLLPFLILGIVCGYSTCVRLMNIVIFFPFALFFLADMIQAARNKENIWKILSAGGLLFAGFIITLIVTWPALWKDTIHSFYDVYKSYAFFDKWNYDVLFEGEKIIASDLPWYYISKWMFISTPELWIFLGVIGAIIFVVRFVLRPSCYITNTPQRNLLLAFMCFLLPIIIIIALGSIVYDGWRHMYFIYPPFVIMMAYGLYTLAKKRFKWILYSLCIIQVAMTSAFMIKAHPFQQVYFNNFVSHEEDHLMEQYELDYWGASSLKMLEWIADNDKSYNIVINSNALFPVYENLKFLPEVARSRIRVDGNIDNVNYYVEFFRTYPYKPIEELNPEGKDISIYERRVLGSPIYRIVKLR